ncbi:hypothetical protein CYMTET_6125 [Cymbomonas tetramitiformis]|uniref:Uncharacterized protein n=1 Tax=Cymbomonas tetramitiformis TaxID=36881 RepID=A0AAE0GY72_9CHLO|nr:hypothetical protein CYMTET_6125 [Cymbomonas tetramitiformis]
MARAVNVVFLLLSCLDALISTYGLEDATLSHTLNASEESTSRALFDSWLSRHGKTYESRQEKERRFRIFKHHVDDVLAHNSQPGSTFRLGLNRFADLAPEEFQWNYCRSPKAARRGAAATTASRTSHISQPLPVCSSPAEVEPRGDGPTIPCSVDNTLCSWTRETDLCMGSCVSPVKDQGPNCSSGWAFAATGALESALSITSYSPTVDNLSAAALVQCVPAQHWQGCAGSDDGGAMVAAYNWVQQENGMATDRQYNYTPGHIQPGHCSQVPSGFRFAVSGCTEVKPDEASLLEAVTQQPVTTSIDCTNPRFQLYHSGVFTLNANETCAPGVSSSRPACLLTGSCRGEVASRT